MDTPGTAAGAPATGLTERRGRRARCARRAERLRALEEGQPITQKIDASARFYLTRNTMTVLAIVLAGFAALPFPGEPGQISWNATVAVVVPGTLLAFGVVRSARIRTFARLVLRYSLVGGAIGALVVLLAYLLDRALVRAWLTGVRSSP